jgi:hypothetical protein
MDSQFDEDETEGGAVLAPPRHRSGLNDGGLSAGPQGWCSWYRRHHGGGLRSDPEANLLDLPDRIKSGHYRAPPVCRAYTPKADGSHRMQGMPTFEDKAAQHAVTMVLEEIYEQDFLSCSYGFRPGRSAHEALRTLQNVLWAKRLYWVLDIDIRKYFDSALLPSRVP